MHITLWTLNKKFCIILQTVWSTNLPLTFQNSDDLLVASAECPSDDEDLEECEPGTGE